MFSVFLLKTRLPSRKPASTKFPKFLSMLGISYTESSHSYKKALYGTQWGLRPQSKAPHTHWAIPQVMGSAESSVPSSSSDAPSQTLLPLPIPFCFCFLIFLHWLFPSPTTCPGLTTSSQSPRQILLLSSIPTESPGTSTEGTFPLYFPTPLVICTLINTRRVGIMRNSLSLFLAFFQ